MTYTPGPIAKLTTHHPKPRSDLPRAQTELSFPVHQPPRLELSLGKERVLQEYNLN